MKRTTSFGRGLALATLLASSAAAAPPAPGSCGPAVDTPATGWASFDPEARVQAAAAGRLRYTYRVRSGVVSLLTRAPLDLTGCASVSFRVRSSRSGGLFFGVSEGDTARYASLTALDADVPTHVRLNLDELERTEDSHDANGRLDLGPSQPLWFLDAAAFGQTLDPSAGGERTLEIEGLAFSAERVPNEVPRPRGPFRLLLDTFEGNLVRWMPIAMSFEPVRFSLYPEDARLARLPGGSSPTALEAIYTQRAMTAFAFVRAVSGLDLARAERLVISVRSDTEGFFLAALEERSGARYEHTFVLAPGSWTRIELPLADFRLAAESRDGNARLDRDAIKTLTIAAARLEPGPERPARFAIDDPGFETTAGADPASAKP